MAQNNGNLFHDVLNSTMGEGLPEFGSSLLLPLTAEVANTFYRNGEYVGAGLFALFSAVFAYGVYEGFLRGNYFQRVYGINFDPLKYTYKKIKS